MPMTRRFTAAECPGGWLFGSGAPASTPLVASASAVERPSLGSAAMAETCYRHPDRETRVACSNCDRPICPECMTPSPVGMRCPECSRQTTKVKVGPAAFGDSETTRGTFVLIGINVVAFLIEVLSGGGGLGASQANPVVVDFGLIALPVADGELYRLITSGFLHYGFIHIAFNMYALFIVGRLLEPAIGTLRFVALYFASLLAGSFGALLLSPNSLTAGASGAIFGIFAAAFVIARGRRLEGIAAQLGILLLIASALIGLKFTNERIALLGAIIVPSIMFSI